MEHYTKGDWILAMSYWNYLCPKCEAEMRQDFCTECQCETKVLCDECNEPEDDCICCVECGLAECECCPECGCNPDWCECEEAELGTESDN